MHSLFLHPSITETAATEAIMAGARSMPRRDNSVNVGEMLVSFTFLPLVGEY